MLQNPKSTRYLLRFDDICPTMDWGGWSEIEAVLTAKSLKPILAVVPDNQDPVLKVNAPASDFWERVRGWQARGWTIALHGYQHKYVTFHRGVVTPRKKSEFAGVPPAEQEEKLRRGVEIFERNGVKSRLWIAPSNSFDASTVSLLPKYGISMICDGYFRYPFICRKNIFWIPQQLHGFRPAPRGIWTVCYHHNQWNSSDLTRFRDDLDRYSPSISSLDEIVRQWDGRRSWWTSFLSTKPNLAPLVIRCQLKFANWWRTATAGGRLRLKANSVL